MGEGREDHLLTQVMDRLTMAVSNLDFQLHLVDDLSEDMLVYKAREYIKTTSIPILELRFMLDNLRLYRAFSLDQISHAAEPELLRTVIGEARRQVSSFYRHLGATLLVDYGDFEEATVTVDMYYVSRLLANLFYYALRYDQTEVDGVSIHIGALDSGGISVSLPFHRTIGDADFEDLEMVLIQKILALTGDRLLLEDGEDGSVVTVVFSA